MTQPGDALGAFSEVRLVHHAAVADLFTGLSGDGRPVVMVVLTPEAGADPSWRAAFSDLIARDRATVNPADPQYLVAHAGDLNSPRPWVGSYFVPGRRGVERILTLIPEALPPGVDPSAMVAAAQQTGAAPFGGPPQPQYGNGAPPRDQYGQGTQQYGPPGLAFGVPGAAPPPWAPPTSQAPAAQPATAQYSSPTSGGSPAQTSSAQGPTDQTPAGQTSSTETPPQAWSTPPDTADPMAFPPVSASAPPSPSPYAALQQPVSAAPYSTPVSSTPFASPQQPVSASPYETPQQPVSASPYAALQQPVSASPYEAQQQPVSAGPYAAPQQFDYRPAPDEHANPLGAPPAAPEKSRAGLLIGLITAVTALVIVAAGFAVFLVNNNDKSNNATSAPTTPSAQTSSALPAETAGPSASPFPLPSTTPTIRANADQVSIVGPTFTAAEKTELIDYPGWPLAFRLPEGWSCIGATATTIPDAIARACVKTAGPSHQQRLNVMLRKCPTTCTAPEQTSMNDAWFDPPEKPNVKKYDPTTYWVETPRNSDGFYALDFSHFFADKPGGTLTYEVGVWFQSPAKYKTELQKAINDVRSQAPQP